MYILDPQKVKKVLSYRYVIWTVLAICYVIVFFHRLATGVVKDDLVDSFGISLTTYASLASTYFYAYLIMQIPSGILADTIGARKTVSIGVFTAGIGSMIFGAAPVIAVAFIGRLLVGLGVSVIYVSILKIISTWFKEEEFGTMTGITSFIGNMGGILAQAPLVVLVGIISWRYAFQLIGILSIILAIATYTIVRNKPQDMKLPSIREIKRVELGLPLSEKNIAESLQESGKAKPKVLKGLGKVLTNLHTWPPFFLFTFLSGGFISLSGTWGQSYLTEVYGFAKSTSANYISIIIFFLAITSIIIGKVSDRIQKRKLPMLVALSVNVACWGILVKFIDSIPQTLMFPFFALFGASFTAFILTWACGKEVNNPEMAGVSMSVINMGGFLGPSVIPTIMGSIIDKYSGILEPSQVYQRAFIVCFICSILAFVSLLLIKETNCKNIYRD
jgi:sugar phosphate permease